MEIKCSRVNIQNDILYSAWMSSGQGCMAVDQNCGTRTLNPGVSTRTPHEFVFERLEKDMKFCFMTEVSV